MKKLKLSIDVCQLTKIPHYLNLKFRRLMRLKRRYSSLAFRKFIYMCEGDVHGNLLRLTRRLGMNITFFSIDISTGSNEFIVKLLKCIPNVVELTLNLGCFVRETPFSAPVSLNKLENLKVRILCKGFIDLIETPMLRKISCDENADPSLETFLQRLPTLTHLSTRDLNHFTGSNYPFRLTSLETTQTTHRDDRVKEFLLFQAATIENLDVFFDHAELHEIVLTKFKRLKYLSTNFSEFQISEQLRCQLKPLRQLKKLANCHKFLSNDSMKAILGNCPEITELNCYEDKKIHRQLNFIARHNKKLETLKLFTIGSTDAKFPFLKKLGIWKIRVVDLEHLISFLIFHPTVTFLKIIETRRSKQEIMKLLILTNVEHLEIGHSQWDLKKFPIWQWIQGDDLAIRLN